MFAWLELASHLNQPLQVVQATTTSMEFVIWMEYLKQKKEREVKQFGKQEHYWAMIACEIRRSYVKHPNKVKVKDFFIEFEFSDKKPEKKKESNWKDRMKMSKSFWGAVLGMTKKK